MEQQSETAEANLALFYTPEAEAVKKEICEAGRKLWLRQYVDGNGGNISYRIGPNEVICTPTLISKYDITPSDLCMVDLEGNQIAGTQKRTSEIFLHLEIFKAAPEVRAAVHCHPPHATAHAIVHRAPDYLTIPEFEVFVGKVPVLPYETPGTAAFAKTVAPYAKKHNAALLANHGVVCWGDTVTHAEWYAEVLETYCWTLLIAAQLGGPINTFTARQEVGLMDIRERYGLPDHRLDASGNHDCDCAGGALSAAAQAQAAHSVELTDAQFDKLVKSVAEAVLAGMRGK
ncbi:MAG TPA: class II aldolase/adducin family protein [Terracidiphilus sp.]|jgi:L-fuculose-phosphate aldolase